MNERSKLIHRLCESIDSRTAYIKAKLGVLVPSQIRALRLRSEMPRQSDLAKVAGLHQSRISMFETPGAANMTIETLARLAASFKVGLVVKFVPFSEMLQWENSFSQDQFVVTPIARDHGFLNPEADVRSPQNALDLLGLPRPSLENGAASFSCAHSQSRTVLEQTGPRMASVLDENEKQMGMAQIA